MSRSKKPVILVGSALSALIVLPLVILIVGKTGGHNGSTTRTPAADPGQETVLEPPVADFDLSQLAKKADKLLKEPLARALKEGDVSLDFMAGLEKQAEKARKDLRSGNLQRSKERFTEVVEMAENKLSAISAAEKARGLKKSTFAELQRLESLRSLFENTYEEAVGFYNQGSRALEGGQFLKSVESFERSNAILGNLEAGSIQQVAALLETAQAALKKYELNSAEEAFEAVLQLDEGNQEAVAGLATLSALKGISNEVKLVRELEAKGKFEEALEAMDRLAKKYPNNSFIENQRASLKAGLVDRKFERFVTNSLQAEKSGDFETAIRNLEKALALKADTSQQKRLEELKREYKAIRLEKLLAEGFDALKGGRYEEARDLYKEATTLDPESGEARKGLERASSLYLANIRYQQNISSAERYIKEGRFPLAAKIFNQAMSIRPEKLSPSQTKKEESIRSLLKEQSQKVAVLVESDGRTYVSIIGVLPPERFKTMDLNLFPDVYKVRGTRKGYKDVEIDLKVDATKGSQTIEVQCSERI